MYIRETNSTNSLLRQMIVRGEQVPYIRTDFQTEGRGQAGNGWESEKGKNLLCSVFIQGDNLPAEQQFDLSVRVTVAIHQLISSVVNDNDAKLLTIKWPNDIYWGDKKLAGILIEAALKGDKVDWAIAGIGLNVNQTKWLSNAPNPTSIKCETQDQDMDIDQLMTALMQSIRDVSHWSHEEQWNYYKTHLYRAKGFWPFVEREVNATPTMNANADAKNQFLARIVDVMPSGEIILETTTHQKKYHFKQIRYVIT